MNRIILWWGLKQLNSRNPKKRERAVRMLRHNMGNTETINLLVHMFEDEEESVRIVAAEELQNLNDVRGTIAFVRLLLNRILNPRPDRGDDMIGALNTHVDSAIYNLRQVLEENAELVPLDDLEEILLKLNNVVELDITGWFMDSQGPVLLSFDCSRLRQLAIQEFESRKLGHLVPLPNSRSKRPVCPKCGAKGICYHKGDVGAGEAYYDLYEFECLNLNCEYKDSKTVYGGMSSWDNWYTSCPYCGQ